MIFNNNQSKVFHITSCIIGIVMVAVGTIIYSLLYKNKVGEFSYDNIVIMIVFIEVIVFGIVLLLINFEGKLYSKIGFLIAGFLIAGFIFNKPFRFGTILAMGTMAAYLIIMRFKNIFSTVVTMTVCATIFLVITLFVLKVVDENDETLAVYGMFSLFIVVYRIFGRIINQWFIDKMLGYKEESKTYDDEQLKNQILLIYMVTFIFLNAWLFRETIDTDIWNLINNSFLTGLAIIQIKWNKIVFYFRNNSEDNAVDEEKRAI